jgi:riboflavin kinase/FMN adenylyltransferase
VVSFLGLSDLDFKLPMKILHHASDLGPGPGKVCVAIGVFDGVHLGHQQVIRQTISDAQQHGARSVAVTFDCHPSSVVAPERTPPLIHSLTQKLRVLASLGIETTLLIRFDRAFSEQSGETFVRSLVRDFGPIHSVCVGSNFAFGHKRGGNVALLKTLGQELKFIVHGLAAVSLDGRTVSSTRIREAIRHGNLEAASQMLGRPYTLAGIVVRGDQLGHKLGYPTANLDVSGLALPPHGVYAVHATARGQTHRAVLNIGLRPTLQNPQPQLRVEAHLLDFQKDLYEQELELTFVEKLRDERKFPSLDALKEQIGRDIVQARALFG